MSRMQHVHNMPFGTRIRRDGRVNFNLWAPRAQAVALCVQTAEAELQLGMMAGPDGWFRLSTAKATCGSHYRFLIDGRQRVPDPASRCQPESVHGVSQVIDPQVWQWQDHAWRGRPWEELVFYELHVGTFTPEGTFKALQQRLSYLAELGVTALQLMPIADFAGQRNWGYDGVLPFAPARCYGTADELKALIDAAHAHGLLVFNDVVYSHFGVEGNYLHVYAEDFFTRGDSTPWGEALNFDAKTRYWVRQFFIHNALYWLEEYHFDGLRFDAVHGIFDRSKPDIMQELAATIRTELKRAYPVYLVLENDHNAAGYLRRPLHKAPAYFDAQWNDDLHHALHVILTGETGGYYQDYAKQPVQHLGRCLTQGFAYQGEMSTYRARHRGEPCNDLPLTAFVSFLQNHDQIGNRALGERISTLCTAAALRAVTAILLLSPPIPLLFMGQEWASKQAFTYFIDFPPDLAAKIQLGRLQELQDFAPLSAEVINRMALPGAEATFHMAKLDWQQLTPPQAQAWLALHRELLALRQQHLVPKLKSMRAGQAHYRILSAHVLCVHWCFHEALILILLTNLSAVAQPVRALSCRQILFVSDAEVEANLAQGILNPWAVVFYWQTAQTQTKPLSELLAEYWRRSV